MPLRKNRMKSTPLLLRDLRIKKELQMPSSKQLNESNKPQTRIRKKNRSLRPRTQINQKARRHARTPTRRRNKRRDWKSRQLLSSPPPRAASLAWRPHA